MHFAARPLARVRTAAVGSAALVPPLGTRLCASLVRALLPDRPTCTLQRAHWRACARLPSARLRMVSPFGVSAQAGAARSCEVFETRALARPIGAGRTESVLGGAFERAGAHRLISSAFSADRQPSCPIDPLAFCSAPTLMRAPLRSALSRCLMCSGMLPATSHARQSALHSRRT